MTPPAAPPEDALLRITVEAADRYLLGFPLVAAVTYENTSADGYLSFLPSTDLRKRRNQLGIRLVPLRGGRAVDIPPKHIEEGYRGIDLDPGESRRMTVDLAGYGLSLVPGVYALIATLSRADGLVSSAPVTVAFIDPSPADAAEAARLRRLGLPPRATDEGQWFPFLLDFDKPVHPSPALSPEARRQLGLHLFLHQAFFGPDDVPRLDPAPLDAVTEPSLQAEIIALKLEITAARLDPLAPRMAHDLLARWPGMRHRVEEINQGEGLLAYGRETYGGFPRTVLPPHTP